MVGAVQVKKNLQEQLSDLFILENKNIVKILGNYLIFALEKTEILTFQICYCEKVGQCVGVQLS